MREQCNADATRGNVASFDCNDYDVALGFDDGVVQSIFSAMEQKRLIAAGRLVLLDEERKRKVTIISAAGALASGQRQ
ncbi:hypothetical protein KMC43_gp05 [Ralstonia phage Raharianne]|uniref:Uncharacterized protein n=2 Tax=Rahariannevirus raharianne TaxID=2846050 RepID=A0A7G5BBA1_9CAUD|nr:hypothetical protein KMC43_gp05 [Ralstonia phage Raharianne]QMV32380.1 hypothetical protein U2_00005 [Ralstonia phage Albius]QMV33574.1 hypothetical protein Y2_00005 [Ralstonia phage Raharianne]